MDDVAAIRRCRAGDRDAFRFLVEHYQAEAVGHAIAILGNREDALDAVQEALLDAFRALGRFDCGQRFYPWFYTILRNCCFKLAARRKRRETVDIPEVFAVGIDGGLDEALELEQALNNLSPQDREIVTLRHLDGLSYEELAERLGIPVGTVMSRLYNARRRLREKLEVRT